MHRTLSCIILTLCLPLMLAAQQARPVVSILGDSYSTFEGYIPAGNAVWYSANPDRTRTDVDDVRQTWWWLLIDEGGYKLGVNDSYSGATVCNTGYRDEDYSDRSFISRTDNLGSPDIILVFGGTNDSWCGAPIGEFKSGGWRRADLYTFRPAMSNLLYRLSCRYPGTRIIVMINCGLKESITGSMKRICKESGVEYVQLEGLDLMDGHPTIKGMKQIKDQMLGYLSVHGSPAAVGK